MPDPATISKLTQFLTLAKVTLPMVGIFLAIVLTWGRYVGWFELGLMVLMNAFTGFGISVGFHRYFTHRSFDLIRPAKIMLAICGSMAAEGTLFMWVSMHRIHHQFADHEGDPHSPMLHGSGLWEKLQGFWHAHVGWLFTDKHTNTDRYIPDLLADRDLVFVNKHHKFWVVLGLVIPAVLGGLVGRTWEAALLGFLWGGLVRMFLVHHATWSVNSICHIYGKQAFDTGDTSTNNLAMALITWGEGWHNNHHAFPSARHGFLWWQWDGNYWVIKLLEKVGIAKNVRVPSQRMLDRGRLSRTEQEQNQLNQRESLPVPPPFSQFVPVPKEQEPVG